MNFLRSYKNSRVLFPAIILTHQFIEHRGLQVQFLHSFLAVICPSFHLLYTSSKLSGYVALGLPKCFPFALAISIPSACRCFIFCRSCFATYANTCNMKSDINVPNRGLYEVWYPRGTYPIPVHRLLYPALSPAIPVESLCNSCLNGLWI